MKKFYMVHATGGSSPNARHETREAARKEAARIASKNTGAVFVLEAIEQIEPKYDVVVTSLE